MMNVDLITPVNIPEMPQINHQQQLLLMGSCFAENMGKWLADGCFSALMNPYGILYNPVSIATALSEIISHKIYANDDLFLFRGLWHSKMHHGSFSTSSEAETLQQINSAIDETSSMIHGKLDRLLITFGTSYIYKDKENDKVVGNCHKRPESDFIRYRISVNDIVDIYIPLIKQLIGLNPGLKIIFTVSPIRHLRDGLIENQRSKATLLLAVSQLQDAFPAFVSYFPSYEIMMDELRDYRFYADDLNHPSNLAIQYLQNRFSASCFSDETRRIMQACQKIKKSLQHRPLYPDSAEYKCFLEKLILKINQLGEKYPYLESRFKASLL